MPPAGTRRHSRHNTSVCATIRHGRFTPFLADAIAGLKVNFKAANIVYLTHPAALELSLGCRGREYSNELYAKTDRKIKPEFFNLVGSAAAVIFTLPKDDTMTGTARCLKRM